MKSLDGLRDGYGRTAARYAAEFRDELRNKPLDRALLDIFADDVRGKGTVGDIGCGPGHVAAYLHERGLPMVGIDLSAGMVATARAAVSGVDFLVGDMRRLDRAPCSLAGIVALYSIVHLEPDDVVVALRELHRVLLPGGKLLLSFHAGDERIVITEFLGVEVEMEWIFFAPEFVQAQLVAAGFAIEAALLRAPYATEHPSQRAYIIARS